MCSNLLFNINNFVSFQLIMSSFQSVLNTCNEKSDIDIWDIPKIFRGNSLFVIWLFCKRHRIYSRTYEMNKKWFVKIQLLFLIGQIVLYSKT